MKLSGTDHFNVDSAMTFFGGSYKGAVDALMSSLHQAKDKESLQKSAERRVKTVTDMRRYWSRIQRKSGDNTASTVKPPKRMIHITGTKGKGSTASLCQAILKSHGYSTGLFTSPHLIDVRERIRLDGHPVHPDVFGKAYWKIRKDLEQHTSTNSFGDDDLPTLPGYFRMLTLMAYYIFSELEVDIWIIEVGMGGRYDATNFLDRDTISDRSVCGVTLLDLDHTRILGKSLEQIAWEKGGIFAVDKEKTTGLTPRPSDSEEEEEVQEEAPEPEAAASGTPTLGGVSLTAYILDSNTPGALEVFRQCASNEGCGSVLQTVDATGTTLQAALGEQALGLAGEHQYGNALLATHLCYDVTGGETPDGLNPSLEEYLHDGRTLEGLVHATWPARCQTVHRSPFNFRLDGAHTPQSLRATLAWFNNTGSLTPHRILVFNCSHERNPLELLDLLKNGRFTAVYFAQADSTRPSPVAKPTAQEILENAGMHVNEDWVKSIRRRPDKESWQETLGILWKHVMLSAAKQAALNGRHTSHYAAPLVCNKYASQIVHELSTTIIEPTEVLVTGSLYIVGSFLAALDWNETSSHDKSALLG